MPEISIIVCAYNAGKYIARCFDSILAQTYSDFEVIVVDDCSHDDTLAVARQYAQSDKRITVLHNDLNRGISYSRQQAVDAAQGHYIIHADADDYIDHDMLECMHGTARKENADVVICDYDEECDGQHTLRRQQPTSLKPRQIVIDLLTGKIHGSCCNKLIARHLYTAPGIKFPAGINCCEDLYVCLCIFARNPVVAYLPRAFYHYVRSSTSITSQLTLSNLEQDAKLRDMVIDHFNHDSELQEIASREMSKYVAFRAFHSRRLTSRQFRQAYHQYARYFLDRHNSMFPFNWFFYLACTGWYRTSLTLYDIYIWLWKTKQRLLHRK